MLDMSKEVLIILASALGGIVVSVYIIKQQWRQYGLLFLVSALVGNGLCAIFVFLDFYSFPVRLFPNMTVMPVTAITTVFPAYVLVGVRYSPKRWPWKIPFYWGIVHVGMFLETYALTRTALIQYDFKWDLWDSYTWWWIYLLLFEWIGGRMVSPDNRRPISVRSFYFGRWAWAVFHFIVIVTIFLGGYYLGRVSG